jgi:hypothetical protein
MRPTWDRRSVNLERCDGDPMAMRATAAGSGVSGNGAMARVASGWRQLRDDSIEQRSVLRKFRAQSRLQAATNPRLWQPPLTLTE